ncbi:redox-regulated ATPase YchF [Nitrospina gracilis]|uniref:redox-regulated ATPase YchF n=1 Tax=Nitrospina gracilis TaxID=35801 RepID=UPI001F011227|nr:redox-regulated ATPase YchF [Nitrospina gracilis]MCF8721313.1 GTP-binding protein YchF [Nitrospina gracilis Nb-211]
MGFTCGLVGLPNVGKSVIFNALTKTQAESGSYAFTTVEANVGVVEVPDPRLETINQLVEAKKKTPTTLQFVDIAGLVKGSSRGEGLGNKFLGNIREVDAIAHIVRCFDDPNVMHVHPKVDPAYDIDVINMELIVADMETLEKRTVKLEKTAKSGDKDAKWQLELIQKLMSTLEEEKPARFLPLATVQEERFVKSLNLLTTKPVLYVCNIDDPASADDNPHVKATKEIAQKEGAPVVVLAGKLEMEIMEIDDPEEQRVFMEEMGLKETGLHHMINEGYQLLDLCTFFTVGEKENRAWTVRKNSKAPQAAGKIHSDIERGFIRAEVFHFDDLVKYKSEHAVKEAGKMRLEGKEYIVKDGDILHFRFNV